MEIILGIIAILSLGIYVVVVFCHAIRSALDDEYSSENHIEYDKAHLLPDAGVTMVDVHPVGSNNHRKFCITVVFEDGFRYVSHDGNQRKNHTFSYTVTLYDGEKTRIINDAIKAHNNALLSSGIEVCDTQHEDTAPYRCGRCGHKGPYSYICPVCGSHLKKYPVQVARSISDSSVLVNKK